MPYRPALQLLRIPFSLFLMPIFWFGISALRGPLDWGRVAGAFVVLHLLVYPASNGYNSYYDRDEGSIGGLKAPPPVTPELLRLVYLFDVLGLLGALLLGWPFAGLVLGYMLVSKAYSYEGIRLKKYPLLSTAAVVVFQGAYTFLMAQVGAGANWQALAEPTNLLLALVFFTMLFKVVATSVTVGAGGNGGMFGTSLVAGALAGFLFARLINLTGLVAIPEVHFVVLGMAGVLAGVVHAPLTAIFLIAEITGGYALFVPLMLVTSLSYLTTKHFEPYSVYTKKLTLKGVDVNADRDHDLLSRLDLHRLLDHDFVPLRPRTTLGELVEVFRHAHRNVFPVVSKSGVLQGIIPLDVVRDTLFDNEHYTTLTVRELMQPPAAIVRDTDTTEHALALLDRTAQQVLPVVDADGVYQGFVVKANILARYRKELIEEGQA